MIWGRSNVSIDYYETQIKDVLFIEEVRNNVRNEVYNPRIVAGIEGGSRRFLSDTDAWVISELKEAHKAKDWGSVFNIIDIMELLHNMSHSH